MTQLGKAIAIAAQAHEHQVDKAGAPYILHPIRVMLQMQTEEEQIVAVLHDVLEDADGWTAERLRSHGFPERVLGPLRLVTKLVGEDGQEEEYDAFIARLQDDPVARRVKMGDLKDNMDLSRIQHPTDRDLKRVAKYEKAYKYLEGIERRTT